MKVLIIGLGSIARKHIAALREIDPAVELVALRSSHASTPVDGVQSIMSLDEIDPSGIDFAIISSPTRYHLDALRLLEPYPMPLFIEKPVVDTPEHAAEVERICHGRLTYVACNLRWLDSLMFLKLQVKLGKLPAPINEVNAYCGSSLPTWRPGTDWRNCYSARRDLGGGVHLDLIHELDYIYWLFGAPEGVRAITRSASTLGISAVDYANYCLIYPHFCAQVTLNYYRPVYRRTLELVMTDRIWTLDLATNTITDHCGRTIYSSDQRIADTYLSQMEYFVNLIARGATASFRGSSLSHNDAKTALDVLNIAYESQQ